MSDYKTKVDYMTARLKNHPVVAFLIVFGLIVIAISTFTDAASRIVNLAREFWSTNSVEVTVNAPIVHLRWSSTSFWHPNQKMEYENELRLPLSFRNVGATPSIIQQVRVLMDSDGHKLTWEGIYEADNVPLAAHAPVDAQIQEHRTQFLPFALLDRNPIVSKTIDFAPINHPEPLKSGTYKSILQVKHNSKEWLNLAKFTFTVPSDFKLSGRDPSGVEFSRYDHWQVFELMHER